MRRLSWLIVFLFAVPATAQDLALFPRLTLTAGGYRTGTVTDVRLGVHGAGSSGTDFNFEDEAGVNADQWTSRFGMRWRPLARHELGVNFFASRRSGNRVIDHEIVFGDTTFPVHAHVNSNVDVGFWDVSYTFWVLQSERNGVGLNAGVSGMAIDMGLGSESSGSIAAVTRKASTDLPVPVIGLEGRHAFTRKFIGQARVAFLPKVTIDDFSAQALVGAASVEYRLADAIALGVSYNYFYVDGQVAKKRFDGDFGMTVRGPEAFVRLVFGIH